MKKSKRNIATAVLLAGALGLAAAGGVSAYLTDYDKAENPFVVGQVKIELQEPGWNPDDHKTMEPGKQIQKDPQIKYRDKRCFCIPGGWYTNERGNSSRL